LIVIDKQHVAVLLGQDILGDLYSVAEGVWPLIRMYPIKHYTILADD
jgi:hypothetical protein